MTFFKVGKPILCCTVLMASACSLLSKNFADSDGVPLVEFTSSDSRYFPEFILKFFSGAAYFTQQFPSLSEARSEMRLIQVKRLDTENAPSNEANLSWSADGVYLSFERITPTHRLIQLKDVAGGYFRELLMMPRERRSFLDGMIPRSIQSYNSGLSWSRDSTQFAFMSNGGVGEYNIYVGAVGKKEQPIARSTSKDGYANWSPDSNELVFVSARTGNGDLYVASARNGSVQRLTDRSDVDIFPQWFPDGKQIIYSSGSASNHHLSLVKKKPAQGWQRPHRITNWLHDDLRPTVSPDGKWIAFYSDSSSVSGRDMVRRWNIHVISAEKAMRRTLTAAELRGTRVAEDVVIDLNTGPAWSPDGRKIFYVKRDPAAFNPIHGYDLFTGRRYIFSTGTRMNRDILVSRLGVLSFRAQVGVWDRVFLALTNQGSQLQKQTYARSKIHYM